MYSMTGFGHAIVTIDKTRIAVEVQSVNRRFLEISLFMPKEWISLENDLRMLIKKKIARGYITVRISLTGLVNELPLLEVAFLKKIKKSLQDLKKALQLEGEIDLSLLLQLAQKHSSFTLDLNQYKTMLLEATEQSLDQLLLMRKKEGEALKKDITKRLLVIKKVLETIQKKGPEIIRKYQKTLYKKLQKEKVFDEDRALREVIIYTEKSDFTEERVRLGSHLEQFEKFLRERNPVGKKMDFLLQEMLREISTIGVKAQDAIISACVVECKSELEKIKEQVQNIE
ncbi:MAG: YicC family protein [Parachlamydiales bacterium]|nr:YicC family protein [Parachlamydiales bacterium]